jgi:hypothetical protein
VNVGITYDFLTRVRYGYDAVTTKIVRDDSRRLSSLQMNDKGICFTKQADLFPYFQPILSGKIYFLTENIPKFE